MKLSEAIAGAKATKRVGGARRVVTIVGITTDYIGRRKVTVEWETAGRLYRATVSPSALSRV